MRTLYTFLPVDMARRGTALTAIGALFTGMLALGAVASVFVSTLSQRTGKRGLVLVSIALGAPLAVAGCLFFASTAGVVLVIAAGTVLTFSSPLLIVMAQKLPATHRQWPRPSSWVFRGGLRGWQWCRWAAWASCWGYRP